MLINYTKIKLLKLVFAFYLLVPIGVWIADGIFTIYSLGQLCGLLGFALLATMPLLTSRFKPLEKGVGQDRLVRWHGNIAKTALILLLLHPTLIILRYLSNNVSIWRIPNFYHTPAYFLGYFLIGSLLVVTISSVYTKKLNLNYEHWKKVHHLTYVVIIGMFIHSHYLGAHLVEGSLLRLWWFGVMAIAAFGMFQRLIILPQKRLPYKVVDLVKETDKVTSVYMQPERKSIIFNPGQFAYSRFYSPQISSEEHHFTLSGPPGKETIRFTIKELGDYTSNINNLKVGDKVGIDGPYGVFSNTGMKGSFLFIAGGIGITPLMSMISTMAESHNQNKVVLLYAVNNTNEIVFKNELEKLSKEEWFEAYFVTERINQVYLSKALEKFDESPKIFLVGPVPMMKSIEKMLKKLNINARDIFTEKFELR